MQQTGVPCCNSQISNPKMLSVTFIVIGWDELLAEKRNVALISFSMEIRTVGATL